MEPKIIFTNHISLVGQALENLKAKLQTYLQEVEVDPSTVDRFEVNIIRISTLDESYAEVNTFTKDGANYEDYFDLD